MTATSLQAGAILGPRSQRAVCFAAGTVAVFIALVFVYVGAPFLGWLHSPPASYGILLAISIYFATHTFLEPRMALLYAPLFIILATAFVPQTFPQPGQSSPPEYFYWATGLFFITFAMALRLPWAGLLWERKRMGVPLSLVLFLLVSVAAGLQGLRLGFSVSYVARQFFGAALFIIYFYAGFVLPETQSEVTKYFHILKWFGMVASVYTIVFYIDYVDLPRNVDSFKWGLSIYCAMLAAYCMAEAAMAKGLLSRIALVFQALILIAQPIVFGARGATGIAAVASALAFVMLLKSRKAKAGLMLVSTVIVFAAIVIGFIAPLGTLLPDIGRAGALIPQDILADPSFIGRANQLVDAIDVIKAHPFLGKGLGSTLVFEETWGGVKEVAAIDQGFAYVMSKFGILGLASFYALVYSVFKRSGWPETNRVHIAAFVLFIFSIAFMVSHPVMLQFIGAGFVGIIAGLLCRARSLRPGPRSQFPSLSMSKQLPGPPLSAS